MPQARASTSPCSRRCPQPMVRGVGERLGAVLGAPAPGARRRPALRRHVRVDRGRRAGSSACASADGDDDRRATCCSSRSASRPRPAGSRARGSCSTTAWSATRRCSPRPVSSRPATSRRWPNPAFDGEVMRHRALDERGRAGRVRRASACCRAAATSRRAVRAGAVRLVRPVRREDPVAGRFAGQDRMEVVHGALDDAPVRRDLRARRPDLGRARRSRSRASVMQYRRMIAERRVVRRARSNSPRPPPADARPSRRCPRSASGC